MNDGPKGYDASVRERLDQADWGKALLVAMKYARAQCWFYNDFLGFEVDADELVQEAIARAYGCGIGAGGKRTFRNWNLDEYPTLEKFLVGIIDSLISQRTVHKEKFPSGPIDETDETEAEAASASTGPDAHALLNAAQRRTPEQIALLSEKISVIREALDALAQEDEDAGMVVLAMEMGEAKPAEVAQSTGLEIKDVYNINKRIGRKLRSILHEIDSEYAKELVS